MALTVRKWPCVSAWLCWAALPTVAQPLVPQVSAVYSLQVREVDRVTGALSPATPGVIDPSEAVRFGVSVSFSPIVGTVVNYVPANPPPGTGPIVGWGATALQLIGQGGTEGSFSSFVAAPNFQAVGAFPMPGGLDYFGAFSPGILLNSGVVNQVNPIDDLISFTWTPSDYSPRSVNFRTAAPQGGQGHHQIGVRVTYPGGVEGNLAGEVPPISISYAVADIIIVPAPGVCVVAGGGLAVISRRRRRPACPLSVQTQ